MGYEFCRVVVREALIGQPLDHRGLRARLQAGMDRPEYSGATVLARHPDLVIGGPGSRRAWYPVEALEALTELARSGGNALVSPETGSPGGIAYAPEVIARSLLMLPPPAGTASGRRYDRHHFEASFARTSDPWSYSSEYERTKYEQTLALLPKGPMARGLELGCAEGHFTELLAPRVDRLVAADISDLALRRAAERCREQGNIEFLRLDLVTDALPGGNDLVVCSEVLYYAGDEPQLADTAARIAGAVRPGGFFLTAHANVAADQPGGTGFDWDVPYGAETIGRTFSGIPDLRLVRELATPLYRIQLYRRTGGPGDATVPPVRQVEPVRALPSPAVARWIRWEPGAGRRPAAEQVVTDRLPVLMYHQVAADGPAARARWRVTPEAFEAQLRYLREAGFHGIRLDDWRAALGLRRPLPGRAVLITFDDGYRDFATVAWPLLQRYGFSAVVFAVSGRVGMTNDWDPGAMGGPELMDWEELRRLRDQGVEIGSHSVSHPRLAHLAPADVVREAALSRATIQRELERPVIAFAYPFGDHDPAIQHLVGACGYDLAFTCFPPGRAAVTGRWLEQSRIEIFGDDDLASFIAKLD
jgi:peptidoglycan/xylan/chitin deacetylase (PgdA/CDA1 family)